MRLFPVNRSFVIVVLLAACLLAPAPALAQQETQPAMTAQQLAAALQQASQSNQQYGSQFPGGANTTGVTPFATTPGGLFPFGQPEEEKMTQAELDMLLLDPNSKESRAHALARQYDRQRDLEKFSQDSKKYEKAMREPPPPDLVELQDVNESLGGGTALSDAAGDLKDQSQAAIDIRRDAQKSAALSYGARGGLAKRNSQIMESMSGYEGTLDSVFNFRALLIRAPSGLLIEPPIVRESLESLVITEGGNEAAVADQVLDINKQAKIVSAPRDWRQYLIQVWTSDLPPPPRLLWPKNKEEQANWDQWVAEGWEAGVAQADEMFEINLNRLVSEYNGMVRYRMLLAQGMISQPYALHEDRGVTGTKTVMRVGDRALRITGPSQFLTGSELWTPADR